MPDTPDPRLYLAEIREDLRSGYSEAATDRIREQHLPALLAAVEGVLKEHRDVGGMRPICLSCARAWPCTTVQVISRELQGISGA
jgi:hypothetical protein